MLAASFRLGSPSPKNVNIILLDPTKKSGGESDLKKQEDIHRVSFVDSERSTKNKVLNTRAVVLCANPSHQSGGHIIIFHPKKAVASKIQI